MPADGRPGDNQGVKDDDRASAACRARGRGMSIGADVISQLPVAAQQAPAASSNKPPKRRQVTAKADAVEQPEAR